MGHTQPQLKNITHSIFHVNKTIFCVAGVCIFKQAWHECVVSHSWWRIWCCILLPCWWAWCHISWPTVYTARHSSRPNNLWKSILRWRNRVNNRYMHKCIPKYKFSFEWKRFLSAPDAFCRDFVPCLSVWVINAPRCSNWAQWWSSALGPLCPVTCSCHIWAELETGTHCTHTHTEQVVYVVTLIAVMKSVPRLLLLWQQRH